MGELRARRKDGTRFDVEAVASLAIDDAGRTIGIMGSFADITPRRRAECKIRRLAAAVEQVAQSVIITDTKGTIQYVNAAFTRPRATRGRRRSARRPASSRAGSTTRRITSASGGRSSRERRGRAGSRTAGRTGAGTRRRPSSRRSATAWEPHVLRVPRAGRDRAARRAQEAPGAGEARGDRRDRGGHRARGQEPALRDLERHPAPHGGARARRRAAADLRDHLRRHHADGPSRAPAPAPERAAAPQQNRPDRGGARRGARSR